MGVDATRAIYRTCQYCAKDLQFSKTRDLTHKKYCSPSCRKYHNWATGKMTVRPRSSRLCQKCEQSYAPTGSRQRWCKTCCPNIIASARMARYGISQAEYDELLRLQGGCAICGDTEMLVIDHDHTCCSGEFTCGECVRGLLCHNCNVRISVLESSPEWLENAYRYLHGGR